MRSLKLRPAFLCLFARNVFLVSCCVTGSELGDAWKAAAGVLTAKDALLTFSSMQSA